MTDHHLGMYSTKRLHKGMVENNQYLCVGDKYTDPVANTFRAKPKGQPEPKAFNIKVFLFFSYLCHFSSNIVLLLLLLLARTSKCRAGIFLEVNL